MLIAAERAQASIDPDTLEQIRKLYVEGYCLRAYELARSYGELRQWRGTAERMIAGRLAPHLGSWRLGMALHNQGWRDDPTDPEACSYRALVLLARRGPLKTRQFLTEVGLLEHARDSVRADWLAIHASVLGRLRDFDAAESWLARAQRISPGRAWLFVQRADLFELEDRYEDALAAAQESLAIRPWYRPAVQSAAHVLQLLGRDAKALAFLTEAADRIESCTILAQLGTLQSELRHHADARRTWDRFREQAPLIDVPTRQWLTGCRSDQAYRCGDFEVAASLARVRPSVLSDDRRPH